MIDREMALLMEAEIIARAEGGPNADPPPGERHLPRVSGIGADCGLALWHYLFGSPKLPMGVEGANSVEIGKILEPVILADIHAALVKKHGPLEYQDQVKIVLPWAVGSADRWYPAIKTVVDSKTGNKAAFAIKGREGFENDAYATQLSIYGEGLGAEWAIIGMRGVGTQKGDGAYLFDRFACNPALVEKGKRVALQAIAGIESGTPPPPAFPAGYWLCKGYCSYRHLCPSGGKS